MSLPTPLPAPPHPALAESAFFFDFDGTIAPIVDTPSAVSVSPATIALLQDLSLACGHALAIVSGRAIEDLDHFLRPLVLPAAGMHGAQWRDSHGVIRQTESQTPALAEMTSQLQAFADAHPGLLVETKPLSVAVHYRHAPQLEQSLGEVVEKVMRPHRAQYTLQPGKMVLEIKPSAASKKVAIERFMALPAFAQRQPVFAGDDLTDEAGFDAVNEMGGLSIKIGEGPTRAHSHLASPAHLVQWLAALR